MGEARELKRLLTLRRSTNEQVRVSLDEAENVHGQTIRYINVRKWSNRMRGLWRPTHVGMTIRLSELGKVLECLQQLQAATADQRNQPHEGETTAEDTEA